MIRIDLLSWTPSRQPEILPFPNLGSMHPQARLLPPCLWGGSKKFQMLCVQG
jgi:hypothetical protein